MIHPNALLASVRKRLIWFKMHKIFCRIKKYCEIYQSSPDFSDPCLFLTKGLVLFLRGSEKPAFSKCART